MRQLKASEIAIQTINGGDVVAVAAQGNAYYALVQNKVLVDTPAGRSRTSPSWHGEVELLSYIFSKSGRSGWHREDGGFNVKCSLEQADGYIYTWTSDMKEKGCDTEMR